MRQEIHPKNYRTVAFKDLSSGKVFLLESTANSSETMTVDGKEYPVFSVDTSSESHPFYTGNRATAKSTGRVERFNRMFSK